ncbi:MAG: hypothetical protein GY835_23915 [bacterium]|nr:hypothetical protein [bacterium]
MTYQHWLGLIDIAADSKDFTVDDGGGVDAIALTPNSYFMMGYTGEGGALVDHMTTLIADEIAGSTVTYSLVTGKVTLNFNGNTTAVVWTDTALRDLLGFTGNLSGATSYVATNEARYCWRPSMPMLYPKHLTSAASFYAARSSTIVQRAPGGKTYSRAGSTVYDASVAYDLLPVAEVLTPTTGTVYADFEQWWLDVPAVGNRFRIVLDRTAYADTDDYVTCMFGDDDLEELGSFLDWAGRSETESISEYNGLWGVQIPLMKYV